MSVAAAHLPYMYVWINQWLWISLLCVEVWMHALYFTVNEDSIKLIAEQKFFLQLSLL